jgi:hypothetical protein
LHQASDEIQTFLCMAFCWARKSAGDAWRRQRQLDAVVGDGRTQQAHVIDRERGVRMRAS